MLKPVPSFEDLNAVSLEKSEGLEELTKPLEQLLRELINSNLEFRYYGFPICKIPTIRRENLLGIELLLKTEEGEQKVRFFLLDSGVNVPLERLPDPCMYHPEKESDEELCRCVQSALLNDLKTKRIKLKGIYMVGIYDHSGPIASIRNWREVIAAIASLESFAGSEAKKEAEFHSRNFIALGDLLS